MEKIKGLNFRAVEFTEEQSLQLMEDFDTIEKWSTNRERERILKEIKDIDFYRLLPKAEVWSASADVLCDEIQKALIKQLKDGM